MPFEIICRIRTKDDKHLPSEIGKLVNLKVLKISCLEELMDLPEEIGKLSNLEKLILDNGNGCAMNILIPGSIGQLQKLRELILYGALDARCFRYFDSTDLEFGYPHDTSLYYRHKIHELPQEVMNLKNLEILDLGRNGITKFPVPVVSLKNLKYLNLEFNKIDELPSLIAECNSLEAINLNNNGRSVTFPDSMIRFKKLTIMMGNCNLKLKDQAALRNRFPNITFSFENTFHDSVMNEETE